MPSVDSVGRHFPFTLATALPPGHDELVDALANDNWLDAADAVARQVLDPAFDVRSLEQAVHDDARAARRAAHRSPCRHAGSRCSWPIRARACAAAWWCEGAAGVDDFVVARELPTDAAFDALWRSGPAGD